MQKKGAQGVATTTAAATVLVLNDTLEIDRSWLEQQSAHVE